MLNAQPDHTLIQALLDPARYPHPVDTVTVLETHISWVLLAGDFAYKIKKPVNFGFLDFSELAQRQFFCHEELRLNQRLAPDLYLAVVSIGGSLEQPIWHGQPAFEYAVQMRRFAEQDLLAQRLADGTLSRQPLQTLAKTLAIFHQHLPPADCHAGFGDAQAVAAPAQQNFQQMAELLDQSYRDWLERLQTANQAEYLRCQPHFNQRLQAGKVRECHGDLHLGNLVLWHDQPIAFDGIEFNPALRWIDSINDIAFLLMDLQHRQRTDLAYAFLNAYLETSGDYAGLTVLRFYLGYRAMVMAKVSAIRAAQLGAQGDLRLSESYLHLAEQFYLTPKPALLITYGLPGCGKTSVSQCILEKHPAIRIRSDVERKRLFGLSAEQSSKQLADTDIYSPQASARTYAHLLALAQQILRNGFSVIVDAAFLKQAERQHFQTLAADLQCPFVIVGIKVNPQQQRQRLEQRQNDASEADWAVLQTLAAHAEALSAQEQTRSVWFENDGDLADLAKPAPAWQDLQRLLQN